MAESHVRRVAQGADSKAARKKRKEEPTTEELGVNLGYKTQRQHIVNYVHIIYAYIYTYMYIYTHTHIYIRE